MKVPSAQTAEEGTFLGRGCNLRHPKKIRQTVRTVRAAEVGFMPPTTERLCERNLYSNNQTIRCESGFEWRALELIGL